MSLSQDAVSASELEKALSLVIGSIALEERSLAGIIEAERDKIEYIIKKAQCGPDRGAELCDVLAVNKSVKGVMESVLFNQIVLKNKLDSAVGALDCHRPCPAPAEKKGVLALVASCQTTCAGRPVMWSRTECQKTEYIALSGDCKRIVITKSGCYSVSFTIDLKMPEVCRDVTLGLISKNGKRMFYLPESTGGKPISVSFSGICITAGCECTELMLSVLSPSNITIGSASILVTEL